MNNANLLKIIHARSKNWRRETTSWKKGVFQIYSKLRLTFTCCFSITDPGTCSTSTSTYNKDKQTKIKDVIFQNKSKAYLFRIIGNT